ncbi:MAG TPA: tripartite tricarboxylate transporter substrate binding protein [Pseudolabrys sp.]|nr:tripartite tricarboxylate transporter substrate binding protein [Pseudolabrys sp.]
MRIVCIVAVALAALFGPASAQSWPERPIRWIVPYPPGGGTDIAARLIGEQLHQQLGQPVVVDNRPGGNTIIGTGLMARSAPDGYTIGLVTDAFAANIALGRQMPYDSLKDLVPVTQLLSVPFVLVVNPDQVSAKTLPDLVTYAKAHPDWLTLASLGPGSPHEAALAWFADTAGIKALIVPYKGGGPAMQDLLAGQVKGMMYGTSSALPMIQAGKVRPLAVTSGKRLDSLPNVPTVAEQGYPGYEFASWFAVVAPANTPQAVIDRLNREINIALKKPQVRDKIVSTGGVTAGGTPADLGQLIATSVERYRKIYALPGVKPQ